MEKNDTKLIRNLILIIIAIFIISIAAVFLLGNKITDLLLNPSLHVSTPFFGLRLFQIINMVVCIVIMAIFSTLGYKKAKQKGLDPLFWAFVCFIFNLWGYIYLLYFKKAKLRSST